MRVARSLLKKAPAFLLVLGVDHLPWRQSGVPQLQLIEANPWRCVIVHHRHGGRHSAGGHQRCAEPVDDSRAPSEPPAKMALAMADYPNEHLVTGFKIDQISEFGWLPYQKPLDLITTPLLKHRQLVLGFHPFGNDDEP